MKKRCKYLRVGGIRMKERKNKGFALRIVQAVMICIYATVAIVELSSMMVLNFIRY